MGTTLAQRVELGSEGTAGSAVPATNRLRWVGVMDDLSDRVFPQENIGIPILQTTRSYKPTYQAQLALDSHEASFEQVGYPLDSGVQALQTTVDTGGSGYVAVATIPVSAVTEAYIQTYTIEAGDDKQAEEMEYSHCQSFEISGKYNEAVMMSAVFLGRQVTTTTFTGSSIPTVEDILFNKGKLYIDDVSGAFGDNQVTNAFLEFTLSFERTGWKPVYTGDGNLYFTYLKHIGAIGSLRLVLEHDTAAIAEKNAWRDGTPKLIRIAFEGSTLTTAGTYSKKTLIIDVAGAYQHAGPLEDDEGDTVLPLTFAVGYDETAAVIGKFIIVNELANLP